MSTSAVERQPGARFTPEERAKRRETLGASEIAAVAGMHKYTSAMDIYLEKIGDPIEVQPSDFLQEAAEWGHRMEEPMALKYAAIHNVTLRKCESHRGRTEATALASCTPDRMVHTNDADFLLPTRGLEIKNRSEYSLNDFGENGTDEVPDDIAAQCHYSLAVMRDTYKYLDHWDVAALIGGNKFRWFRLHYDADLSDGLLEIGRRFMVDNVAARVAPDIGGSERTQKWLQEKFRIYSEVMVDATPEIHDLIVERRALVEVLDKMFKRKEYLDTELKNFIGHNTGVNGPGWYATWKMQKGNPSYKAVAEELGASPALIEKHRGESFRKIFVNTNKLK